MRNCARVYLEWKRLKEAKEKFDEVHLMSRSRLLNVVKNAAQTEYEDDTLWRLLIFFMQDGHFATISDFRQVMFVLQTVNPGMTKT